MYFGKQNTLNELAKLTNCLMQMGFVEFARYRPRSNQPTGLIKNALINEVQTSRDDVGDGKEGTVGRPNWSGP